MIRRRCDGGIQELLPSIRRGTTPTISVAVDTDLSSWPTVILSLYGTGSQLDLGKDRLTVTKSDSGCLITATLTQDETLAFCAFTAVRVQVRAKDAAGRAVATDIAEPAVERL